MSCKHITAAELHPPGPNQVVYREDCTQCFDSIDDPGGLDVCLYCFNGGCVGERNHAALHFKFRQHPLALNIRRVGKKCDKPPQKMSQLAILAGNEADRYDSEIRVRCYDCEIDDVDKKSGKLPIVIDGAMHDGAPIRCEKAFIF